jgi:tetratricopeptide (TPR) repeat protein
LAAIAQTTEEEIDSGQWSKQVSVEGKHKRCKILIPDLLNPPDRKEWLNRGMIPERRGNERHFGLIQSLIKQNEGMDLDQLNELINRQFTGSVDDFDYPSETPFDCAENLCYAAIDTYGRRRIQLARQALQEDPSHTEATLLLAESTFDAYRKIELFRKAIEHGEAQCAELLETEVGQFWGLSETRPLLRAKYGLASALAADGQVNEAITQMLDILRLNQNDNLGVRYEIIPLLLSQNKEKEAVEILNRYSEETGIWLYLKAQVEFHREGPSGPSARKAIQAAIKFNPHVIKLLMADHPPMMPEHYALGSPGEAAVVIEEQLDSWTESEGFVEWMIQRAAILEREANKRQRDRKRKLQAKKRKSRKFRK